MTLMMMTNYPPLTLRDANEDDSDSDSEDEEDTLIKPKKITKVDINEAHHKWGHHGDVRLKKWPQ